MDWVRVDVDIMRDPEIVLAGRDAFLMYMHGLTYAGEQETDGFVPLGILRLCPWVRSADASADKLATPRLHPDEDPLWIPGSDGYTIRGFTKKQPAKEAVEQKRSASADRMRRMRARRRVTRASDASDGVTPPVSDALDVDVDVDVTKPDLPDLTGLVGLDGGSGGKPDRSAADQDQGFDSAVVGQFTPVLGDRLAYCWAKVRRSGGGRWANVIPEVFADLAAEHGPDAVSSAIEALSLADPNDLRGVERPRAYVVKTVADHAGKQAAIEGETVAKTSAETK